MTTVTLEQYEAVERDLAVHRARISLVVHAVVALVVSTAAVAVNALLVPDVPWSAFVVGGTGIGLLTHWVGYRYAEEDVRGKQRDVESRIRAMNYL